MMSKVVVVGLLAALVGCTDDEPITVVEVSGEGVRVARYDDAICSRKYS